MFVVVVVVVVCACVCAKSGCRHSQPSVSLLAYFVFAFVRNTLSAQSCLSFSNTCLVSGKQLLAV